jgi:hypothetical protein
VKRNPPSKGLTINGKYSFSGREKQRDMVEISFKYKVMIYVTILITERANGKIVN